MGKKLSANKELPNGVKKITEYDALQDYFIIRKNMDAQHPDQIVAAYENLVEFKTQDISRNLKLRGEIVLKTLEYVRLGALLAHRHPEAAGRLIDAYYRLQTVLAARRAARLPERATKGRLSPKGQY